MSRPRSSASVVLPGGVASFALLAGLAYGGMAQGGYHARHFVPLLSMVLVAAVAARVEALPMRLGAIAVGSALLACSVLMSAWSAGAFEGALPALGLVLVLAIVGTIVEALGQRAVEVLSRALSLLGCGIALTSWVGVATRLEPWGRVSDGLWRGSSSLTYSNAAASLIGALLLFTTAQWIAADSKERRRLVAVAQFVMVAGLLCTQSRAGIAATALGGLVLLPGTGLGPLVRTSIVPVVAAVAAGLVAVTTASVDGVARPLWSIGAFAVGLVVVVTSPDLFRSLQDRSRFAAPALVAGCCVALAGGAWFATTSSDSAIPDIIERRLTLSSDTASRDVVLFGDRAHEWSAAMSHVEQRPLLGVGPGQLSLRWLVDGNAYRARFVHNEYLEVAATQGLVGIFALVTAIALVADGMRRRWSSHERHLRWGVLSAITVLMAHSALDFLWHVPLIPMVVVMLAAMLLRRGQATAAV